MIKKEHLESMISFFTEIYKGNNDAIDLALMLFDIAQVWDDLIDDDEVSKTDINNAFLTALIKLPLNHVYRGMPEMPYHMYNVFLRWRDATNIESSSTEDGDLNKCYMLRAGIYDLFVLIAASLFGDEYAEEIGPSVRRFYGESLNDYKSEFKNA